MGKDRLVVVPSTLGEPIALLSEEVSMAITARENICKMLESSKHICAMEASNYPST